MKQKGALRGPRSFFGGGPLLRDRVRDRDQHAPAQDPQGVVGHVRTAGASEAVAEFTGEEGLDKAIEAHGVS